MGAGKQISLSYHTSSIYAEKCSGCYFIGGHFGALLGRAHPPRVLRVSAKGVHRQLVKHPIYLDLFAYMLRVCQGVGASKERVEGAAAAQGLHPGQAGLHRGDAALRQGPARPAARQSIEDS